MEEILDPDFEPSIIKKAQKYGNSKK